MTLRLSRTVDELVVTTHPIMPLVEIQRFIVSSRSWIEAQLSQKQKLNQSFFPNMQLSLIDESFLVIHQEGKRRHYEWSAEKIIIKGPLELFEMTLLSCLRDMASQKCTQWSDHYARQLGVSINRIAIKDVKGRWGSCSSRGNLNYNWRIIFASESILRYLCAHEVSHLKHMNHSPDFWRVVASLCPDYQRSRKWLKTHGNTLYGFG